MISAAAVGGIVCEFFGYMCFCNSIENCVVVDVVVVGGI